jgi:glycosyltransferase involved in cell wall biosynthesis
MENMKVSIQQTGQDDYRINGTDTVLINATTAEIPMVSVTMICYNHADYIEQAIKGVLMQKTSFKFVLVIGEDCGNDHTREIIKNYQKLYPDKIILKLPEKNLGVISNSISNKFFCNGKYIAECEGDDYWTDDLKLQKQVDFLESNDQFIIHSANAVYLATDNPELNGTKLHADAPDRILSLEDFISRNKIITCTVMFRNRNIDYPEGFASLTFSDWFIYMMLLEKSGLKAYKSSETYAAYRVLTTSLTGSLSSESYLEKHILQISAIKKYLRNRAYSPDDLKTLNNYFFRLFKLYVSRKQFTKALLLFAKNLGESKFRVPYRMYLGHYKSEFFKIR